MKIIELECALDKLIYSSYDYREKNNISGKNRLISIMNPAVNVIHIAPTTGTVDKYFIKFLSICFLFPCNCFLTW